jgi:2-iminobutanoate/2-iminopropanoate deaminase
MVHRFNPASMAAPFSPISQGVEVEAGERTIYVARQVGVRPDGTMSDDMEGQTEQIFLNIQTILRERSIDLEDLIETRTYVTSKDHIPGYRAGRAKVLGTGDDAPRTAAALVVVAGLAQDHWKVEICAVAAKK